MSKHQTYTITAGGSDGWWALTVSGPGLRRSHHTQVKRLEQAEEMARDLVVTMLDANPSEIGAEFELTVADDEVAASDPAEGGLTRLRALGEQLRHRKRRRLTDA